MNRTSKEATVQRFHYPSTDELNEPLQGFLLADNHTKRFKALRGLTPDRFVCAQWQQNPTIFTRDPPPSHFDYTVASVLGAMARSETEHSMERLAKIETDVCRGTNACFGLVFKDSLRGL